MLFTPPIAEVYLNVEVLFPVTISVSNPTPFSSKNIIMKSVGYRFIIVSNSIVNPNISWRVSNVKINVVFAIA